MKEIIYYYKANKEVDNIKNIKKILKKKNLCIVKNFFYQNHPKLFNIIKKKFLDMKERKISGPFIYKMRDFKRFDIGDRAKNPRFAKFLTFFEWNKNELFYQLLEPYIKLRNDICGYKKKQYEYFSTTKKKYKWCDLIRVIQYPVGGGFLHKHNDKDPDNLDSQVNLLIPITSKKKGKNSKFKTFSTGGLYYIINKEKVNIEKFLKAGDLIFHNLNIDHGVNSIDDEKNLDLVSFNGRVSLNFSVGKFFIT